MLHIVNGDGFGRKLREAAPDAEILVWRESLYEGPMSVLFNDERTRMARAAYFRSAGVPAGVFERQTAEQESRLARSLKEQEEIVLWFEHDLYDQAMLIFLLQFCARYREGRELRLHLLCIDSFPEVHPFTGLGQLTPSQTASLWGDWQRVSEEQLQAGVSAWEIYAGSDPREFTQLLGSGTTQRLPYLHAALECHLRRFPSVRGGLNAVQATALRHICGGTAGPHQLFNAVSREWNGYGLGDSQFWGELNALLRVKYPLIEMGGRTLPDYSGYSASVDWQDAIIRATPLGEAVMSGREDHVRRNGISSWIGGVHLQGSGPIWRWDEEKQALEIF